MRPLRVLIADDEAPARQRLVDLLNELATECPSEVVGEAGNGLQVLGQVMRTHPDVVLLDIQMPGLDGLETARHLTVLDPVPAVVFVTAYDEYALRAFEVRALDYLLKPVRKGRLAEALARTRPLTPEDGEVLAPTRRHLCCTERGRVWLVPVEDVLYLRADLKYVTARTREREYLLDEPLVRLEEEFPDTFVRIHRNCLVARAQLAGFEQTRSGEDVQWAAVLKDWPEHLPVSRRQQHVVKGFRTG